MCVILVLNTCIWGPHYSMNRIKVQNSPSIRRMPTYLHKLLKMQSEGRKHVSSTELAQYMNIESIVVRKDIALTGIVGLRRVGYDVEELITYIKNFLGWQDTMKATLIGAGSLGTALLGYNDFDHYGLHIESVFDADPGKIGHVICQREVYDIATLEERLKDAVPDIAIICVSGASAQEVADLVVKVGITYIWNFANVSLQTPPHVAVQREVIAGGLAMLSVKRKMGSLNPGSKVVIE